MAALNLLLVKLLTICIVNSLMFADRSECFSTPAAKTRAPAKTSMRSAGNVGAQPESSTDSRQNVYTANYITAIENDSPNSGERGFMVSTSDHNYAIYSPALSKRGWLTVTVNGDQVFIVTTGNLTQSASLFGLDEQQRDFLAEVRSNFTQNLGGLKFAHYTSGSSTHLPKLASFYPAHSASSVASTTINQMAGYNSAGLLGAATPAPALASIPQGAATAAYSQIDSSTPGPLGPSAKAGLLQSNGLPPSAGAFFSRSLIKSKRSFERLRGAKRLKWRARNGFDPAAETYGAAGMQQPPPVAQSTVGPGRRLAASESLCSDRSNENFNYYNLLQAPLNVTLTGDVYYFDLHCNILDVYSASVSVRQEQGLSAVYRDVNFFSYARPALPLAINRFFLSDEQVFFVYNDGSLLVKTDWMLDPVELDVVIEARQQLKLVGHWQGRAADLLAKSVIKKKSPAA